MGKERVIPFFDLEHPRSEPAWNGYLYTSELPRPELFALLKPHSTWCADPPMAKGIGLR